MTYNKVTMDDDFYYVLSSDKKEGWIHDKTVAQIALVDEPKLKKKEHLWTMIFNKFDIGTVETIANNNVLVTEIVCTQIISKNGICELTFVPTNLTNQLEYGNNHLCYVRYYFDPAINTRFLHDAELGSKAFFMIALPDTE